MHLLIIISTYGYKMYVHGKHCKLMPQNLLKSISIYPVLPVPGPCYSLAKNDELMMIGMQ